MMASLGSWIRGSGTSSTRTSRRPCHVTARMLGPSGWGAEAMPVPRLACGTSTRRGGSEAGQRRHERLEADGPEVQGLPVEGLAVEVGALARPGVLAGLEPEPF